MNEKYPIVEFVDSTILIDGSMVIKVKAEDGTVYLHRFLKDSPMRFQETMYSDWPVLVADGGIMSLPAESSPPAQNNFDEALQNLINSAQQSATQPESEKPMILPAQKPLVKKEKKTKKKTTKKRKPPKKQ